MRVTGGKLHPLDHAAKRLLEQFFPALSGLSEGGLEAESLSASFFTDADHDQGLCRADCSLTLNV